LYKRVGELTVNKSFLNGVDNFKWKTTSENIKKQIKENLNMRLLPEKDTNLLYEKLIYAKHGSFANVKVSDWCFTFYYNKLYKIEIKFDSDLNNNEVRFVNILDSINRIYGLYSPILSVVHENRFYWYFNNYDEAQSFLGKIILDKNDYKGADYKIALIFEYRKDNSMKEK
jgi:hypothetical protein